MKNVYLYPYKMGSRSSSALADALQSPQIRHKKSKFKGAGFRSVINWGAAKLPPEVLRSRVINKTEFTTIAGNKLRFFEHQTKNKGARLVPYTTSQAEAADWSKKKFTVVVRNHLTSHSGRGIVIVEPGDSLPKASLYTQYIPKDAEFRIHVLGGKIIFRQRKIKDPEISEPKTWKVRSHDNGFIFQHNDLSIPKDVEDQALLAMKVSGLDFGGVDVIWNAKRGKAYILEVNCACGLEGETIIAYANAFRNYLK